MTTERQLTTFHRNNEFLRKLTEREALFLVVGGLAVRYYVAERVVDDLDILIEPSLENVQRIVSVFSVLGFRFDGNEITRNLAEPWKKVEIKNDYYFDLLTPPAELDFKNAFDRSVSAKIDNVQVRIPAIPDLLTLKKIAWEKDHREKDWNDIQALEKIAV